MAEGAQLGDSIRARFEQVEHAVVALVTGVLGDPVLG